MPRKSPDHKWMRSLQALLFVVLARLVLMTLRKSFVNFDVLRSRSGDKGLVLAIWHNQMLAIPVLASRAPGEIGTFTAPSRNGDLIARLARSAGIGVVRCSASPGDPTVLEDLLQRGRTPYRHLALAPEDSGGPSFVVQDGIVILAQRTGRPVCPVAVAYESYLEPGRRDGFLIPYPFTKAYFVCGDPVYIPGELDPAGHDLSRRKILRALVDTNARAMSMRTGKG